MSKIALGVIIVGLILMALALVGSNMVDTTTAIERGALDESKAAPGGNPWFIVSGLIAQMVGCFLMLRDRVMDKSKFPGAKK